MFEHFINSRPLTAIDTLNHELSFEPHKNYLFDLSYLSGLQINGDNAHIFLQGQLTCDLKQVTSSQMQQGALCNLKGRVLALVDVLQSDKYGVQLILPSDLIPPTETSLAKTAQFSKVTLKQAQGYQLLGFYLQNPDDLSPINGTLSATPYQVIQDKNYCYYGLGHGFYIFLVDESDLKTLRNPFQARSQWRGSLAWHLLQLKQKRIEIYPESRAAFLPHRLGLQHMGYINFNKGCYKGQEIIARTHYKATLKHELRIFTIQTKAGLKSGQRLLAPDSDQEIGELVDYAPLGNGLYIIAASILIDSDKHARIDGHMIEWL